MRLLLVVQARLGSSRLPGKVLLEASGAPLLERMLERVRAARTPFLPALAIPAGTANEPLAELGQRLGIDVFRGHETDLLDRHYQAGLHFGADALAKVPSDCPLIDPAAIDRVLGVFRESSRTFDYVSNLHPASWPDGNDVEVMTMKALAIAWREAQRPFEREHTTPFLWDQPGRFRLANVAREGADDLSMSHRFTLDYPEDHAFVAAVYEALYSATRPVFSLHDILNLLEGRPDIRALNARHAGVNWYRHHLAELRTVQSSETRSESGS
jgi:spore coat polysaccharide biosynthesis protein SpsF